MKNKTKQFAFLVATTKQLGYSKDMKCPYCKKTIQGEVHTCPAYPVKAPLDLELRGQIEVLEAARDNALALAESFGRALELIAKDTVIVPCHDPNCGDSTWDHNCTAGTRKPSPMAEIAISALKG